MAITDQEYKAHREDLIKAVWKTSLKATERLMMIYLINRMINGYDWNKIPQLEMAYDLNISKNTSYYMVKSLVEKGFIEKAKDAGYCYYSLSAKLWKEFVK